MQGPFQPDYLGSTLGPPDFENFHIAGFYPMSQTRLRRPDYGTAELLDSDRVVLLPSVMDSEPSFGEYGSVWPKFDCPCGL